MTSPFVTGATRAGSPPPVAFKSAVPVGTSGTWRLEHFEVPAPHPDGLEVRPWWARDPAGIYTRLVDGNEVYMSDLYVELYTQAPAIDEARARGGRILITGLGMGLVIEAMLADGPAGPPIEQIVVVEYSADVVALVAPYLEKKYGDRVVVLLGDARTWTPKPGERFTVGWHDIWADPWLPLAAEESEQMIAHHAPWCDWQGSWSTTFVDEATSAKACA